MSNSLLTKLLGRMELSPVSSSQCSNEPVTMEMSLLPSPAPGKRDAQVQHQGSWLFPTASGTPADSNPNPKAGLEKLLLAPGCWHGCRARWPRAHCAPQSQLELADGYSWGPTAPAALCVRSFLQGCWLLLDFLSQGAAGTGSVFVQPHAVSDGRAGMEKHPWVQARCSVLGSSPSRVGPHLSTKAELCRAPIISWEEDDPVAGWSSAPSCRGFGGGSRVLARMNLCLLSCKCTQVKWVEVEVSTTMGAMRSMVPFAPIHFSLLPLQRGSKLE